MTSRLQVSQRSSEIGRPEAQRKVLKGLGLRGIGSRVTVDNTPSFRGIIKKVLHLVDFAEVADVNVQKTRAKEQKR